MNLFRKKLIALSSFISIFFLALAAHAQLGQRALEETGVGPSGAGDQLPVIVGNIVRALITTLGLVFLVLLIYGGFLWMTARGDSDKAGKAKDALTRAIIGLIIIVSAYAITTFVVSRIVTSI